LALHNEQRGVEITIYIHYIWHVDLLVETMSIPVVFNIAIALISSYLIGSLPTAYVVGRLVRGIDIRRVGSRNMGAMNVFYNVGIAAGLLVLAVDIGKGAAAVFLAYWLGLPLMVQLHRRSCLSYTLGKPFLPCSVPDIVVCYPFSYFELQLSFCLFPNSSLASVSLGNVDYLQYSSVADTRYDVHTKDKGDVRSRWWQMAAVFCS